jgi:murein DD-endopeptidase MepM/ murein hydrolase activator NlpD
MTGSRSLHRRSAAVVLVWTAAITVASPAGAQDPDEDCNRAITPALFEALASAAAPLPPEIALPAVAARAPEPGVAPDPATITWEPSRGASCHRYRGQRVCEGPRRRPVPHGPAAELAARLGLGTLHAAHSLEGRPPDPRWLAAVEGDPPPAMLVWPVQEGRLWRGFGRLRGRRRHPHEGLDIGAAEGAPVRAVADGLVVYSDNGLSGYGNVVLVLHRDATVARYAHLRAAYVFAGQQVRAGAVIAEVGDTGLARGYHLHFELHEGGRPRDPLPRFPEGSGGPLATPPPDGEGSQ